MKETNEIITYLEDQILLRANQKNVLQNEMDSLNKCIELLKESEPGNISSVLTLLEPNQTFPDYPLNEGLASKFCYLEQISLRVWKLEEMKALIEKAEGIEHAEKTMSSVSQKIHYLLTRGNLIRVKYDNKNNYSFYTTRKEWFELEADGSIRLLPEHEPIADALAGLTELQKTKVTITGLTN